MWLHENSYNKGEPMEEMLTLGKTTANGAVIRSRMESNIVETMNRYFRDDKGKMSNLELSIMNSVKRYFEEPPPKRVA